MKEKECHQKPQKMKKKKSMRNKNSFLSVVFSIKRSLPNNLGGWESSAFFFFFFDVN